MKEQYDFDTRGQNTKYRKYDPDKKFMSLSASSFPVAEKEENNACALPEDRPLCDYLKFSSPTDFTRQGTNTGNGGGGERH